MDDFFMRFVRRPSQQEKDTLFLVMNGNFLSQKQEIYKTYIYQHVW